jgi:hypothetical protein
MVRSGACLQRKANVDARVPIHRRGRSRTTLRARALPRPLTRHTCDETRACDVMGRRRRGDLSRLAAHALRSPGKAVRVLAYGVIPSACGPSNTAVPDSAVPDSAVPDSAVPDSAGPDSNVPPADTGPDSSQRCSQDTDCVGPNRCYFAVSEGCAATGGCLPAPFVGACRAMLGCACDGTDVALCAPAGYSPKPFAHLNHCFTDASTESSADAMPTDADATD